MKQGEVRWYTFRPPDKRCPVLILTRNSAIGYLSTLTIAPITGTLREIPSQVALVPEDGLRFDCAVNLHSIQTVPKEKLGGLIAQLTPQRMSEIKDAIAFALGFDAIP